MAEPEAAATTAVLLITVAAVAAAPERWLPDIGCSSCPMGRSRCRWGQVVGRFERMARETASGSPEGTALAEPIPESPFPHKAMSLNSQAQQEVTEGRAVRTSRLPPRGEKNGVPPEEPAVREVPQVLSATTGGSVEEANLD